jgi:hypothetical protein
VQDPGTQSPRCGGETEGGFLVDTVFPGNNMSKPQGENLLWARGSRSAIPKPDWLSKLTSGLGFLISSAKTRPVVTRRCVRCGYLELYAR